MPYINQEMRARLDGAILALSQTIVELSGDAQRETALAGLLNYAITQLSLQAAKAKFGRIRYGHIALLTGVFKNVADEFYRRVASEYEDKQAKANGDLAIYGELLGREPSGK